jgi:hypothetical protein
MNIIEQYAKFEADQKAEGKVCGSCELFTHEDMMGEGWCEFDGGGTSCKDTCRHWTARDESAKKSP